MIHRQKVQLSIHNPPKLTSIADGISMVASGCRSRATALIVRGESSGMVLPLPGSTTCSGFLVQAPSGSSTWIWKAGCLVKGFSEQLLPKSSFLQDKDCEES